jgi:hypothetical protein
MLIVIVRKYRQMITQAFSFFRRAPGFSNETVYIGPGSRKHVVDAEQGIKSYLLLLALAGCRSPLAFECDVLRFWKGFGEISWIVRVLV